jgi:hypothetical protein
MAVIPPEGGGYGKAIMEKLHIPIDIKFHIVNGGVLICILSVYKIFNCSST